MLFFLDLTPSLNTLCRSRLLSKLEPVLKKGSSIFNIVSSFLNLAILDEDKRDWSEKHGVPDVGLLASVLLNFYLDDLDRKVINRFPSLNYVRFINEARISIPQQSFISKLCAAAVLDSEKRLNRLRDY